MTTMNIDYNFGQASGKIVNHYHGHLEHYCRMDVSELLCRRKRLRRQRLGAYRAFVRHPTVPWFVAAAASLVIYVAAQTGRPMTGITVAVLLGCAGATVAAAFRMARQRQPIFDALQMIQADLKLVEAHLVIKQLEVAQRETRGVATLDPAGGA